MDVRAACLFVLLGGVCARPAVARSERAEFGLAVAVEGETTRLIPDSSAWPRDTFRPSWHPLSRLGAQVHYGWTDRLSIGVGVLASVPVEGSARAAASMKSMAFAYREVIVPVSLAATLGRSGMVFYQLRLEAGPALQSRRPLNLTVSAQGPAEPSRQFSLGFASTSWSAVTFFRLGAPVIWRLHDRVSSQAMPYVALLGRTQWQVGINIELTLLSMAG